jgi:hypothetical protein
MPYTIGQYNNSSSTNSMTIITDGVADRIPDYTTGGTGFTEERLVYTGTFEAGKTYYFHGQIKRFVDKQVFNVFLMDDVDFSETQFIRNIVVDGAAEGWYDVEFLFTPLRNFNSMGFILNRTVQDHYPDGVRYPVIIYQELCEVNNLLPSISGGIPLIQLGIKSRPGLITMINGEEIRLGKSGIYEIRDEVLKVFSFSVVGVGNLSIDVEETKKQIDEAFPDSDLSSETLSVCLFDKVVGRDLPDFSVDYIYKED